MKMIGRVYIGLTVWICIAFCRASLLASPAASTPANPPAPAPPPVSATASAPAAKKPSVDEILATRPKTRLNFQAMPIPRVLSSIATAYDFDVVNNYDKELAGIVTMNFDDMSARDAINSVNGTIVALGYTIVESVRGDPPRVVLTVVPTRNDAGRLIPVYQGGDPEQIPESGDIRTQIMSFKQTDPDKLNTFLAAVVGKDAKITINPGNKIVTITDTATHVRAAAKLLQLLESQPPEGK